MLSEMSDSCTVFWNNERHVAALEAGLREMNLLLMALPRSEQEQDFSISGISDIEMSQVRVGQRNWCGINLPLRSNIGDKLASSLAKLTARPAIAFFEFDQAAWGLSLFQPSSESHHFVNTPQALELSSGSLHIDTHILSRPFDVAPERIERYLQFMDAGDIVGSKAYPADQFSLGDHWVRTDVMQALGLDYPDPTIPDTKPYFIKSINAEPPPEPVKSGKSGLMYSLFSRMTRGQKKR